MNNFLSCVIAHISNIITRWSYFIFSTVLLPLTLAISWIQISFNPDATHLFIEYLMIFLLKHIVFILIRVRPCIHVDHQLQRTRSMQCIYKKSHISTPFICIITFNFHYLLCCRRMIDFLLFRCHFHMMFVRIVFFIEPK